MNAAAEQTLAEPQEFNEALASAQRQVVGPAPKRGGGKRGAVLDDGGGVLVSPVVPTIPYLVKIGNQERTVHVVDKHQEFTIPHEQLRARWQDVARRPKGKVCVYDADGKMLARFKDWPTAQTEFRKANMLEAVEKHLAERKKIREDAEADAREERERNRKAA